MTRKINLILQGKGGTGKSLYTSLRALSEIGSSSLFVDADGFAKTSSDQLIFLPEKRRTTLSLQTTEQCPGKISLTNFIQSLNMLSFQNEAFIDFGSLESRQILELDLNNPDFAPDCDALGLNLHFHIIVAGGGNYKPCEQYLTRVYDAVDPWFELTAWKNQGTFSPFPQLSDQLDQTCEKLGIPLRNFANFDPDSYLGGRILNGIIDGLGLESYQTGPMLQLKRELKVNFNSSI